MIDKPITVTPETSVQEAMSMMATKGCLQLPVMSRSKLVGIITDRDICLIVHSPILGDMTVGDCMTSDPVTVTPDTPAFRTAQILSTYKFGALPVVEGDELVGVITTIQLLEYFACKWEKR